jgi:hypothetical protein
MFPELTLEELTELCAKMGRALHRAHDVAIRGKPLDERSARRDVQADLMSFQPDLWRACRRYEAP